MFEDERLIEDILVYEEDDVIAAEVYPNFKYAPGRRHHGY